MPTEFLLRESKLFNKLVFDSKAPNSIFKLTFPYVNTNLHSICLML